MPTVSPSRRAGGLMRGVVEEDIRKDACYEKCASYAAIRTPGIANDKVASRKVSSLTQKKLSPANQPGGPAKKHRLPFPAHGLDSSRSVHSDRRFCPARRH